MDNIDEKEDAYKSTTSTTTAIINIISTVKENDERKQNTFMGVEKKEKQGESSVSKHIKETNHKTE